MIDVVLSPHVNAYTCGTAKWNVRLAAQLGVPCLALDQDWTAYRAPLLSTRLTELVDGVSLPPVFDLFVHDWVAQRSGIVQVATRVYAANAVLAETIRPLRPDVVEGFCPSPLVGHAPRHGLRLLTFGMAHKVQVPYYGQLKRVLDASQSDYSVQLSCAVHEGQPWEQTIGETWERMRAVFGDHARLLGYLADDALLAELRQASGAAVFLTPAARANNTSLWTVLDQGCPLVTNLDADSPPALIHDVSVFDIAQLTEWPRPDRCRAVRRGGQAAAAQYGWTPLLALLQAHPVLVHG